MPTRSPSAPSRPVTRSHVMKVRLTPAERKQVGIAADRFGVSAAELLRHAPHRFLATRAGGGK